MKDNQVLKFHEFDFRTKSNSFVSLLKQSPTFHDAKMSLQQQKENQYVL